MKYIFEKYLLNSLTYNSRGPLVPNIWLATHGPTVKIALVLMPNIRYNLFFVIALNHHKYISKNGDGQTWKLWHNICTYHRWLLTNKDMWGPQTWSQPQFLHLLNISSRLFDTRIFDILFNTSDTICGAKKKFSDIQNNQVSHILVSSLLLAGYKFVDSYIQNNGNKYLWPTYCVTCAR
jgi:hypothetical protein